MRALPLLVLLLAAACRTAPAVRTAPSPTKKAYYLLKGPATVGWVADRPGTWILTSTKAGGPEHPFRWASYDPKAESDLSSEAQAAPTFGAFAERAKQKGYRLVATRHGP